MPAEIECIEVPLKLQAYQFKGSFDRDTTPKFVYDAFDTESLAYQDYDPEHNPDERKYFYKLRNKQTDAVEHIHRMDWFVQYLDKVVIVSEVDFIKNYIQLTSEFRIMIGTVLI